MNVCKNTTREDARDSWVGVKGSEFLYNSSVNMIFGAKSDFLGNQMKAGE